MVINLKQTMSQSHSNGNECIRQALTALRIIADEFDDNFVSREAESALVVLDEQRFNVAFIGQFKRGKSSLINAILGEEILPADMLPITSVITVVQFGDIKRCIVNFQDGHSEHISIQEIPYFVSEANNPSNVKSVKDVVLELPIPILQNGIRLVDTPGVGSIFALNTETTKTYIPKIDIAVVVLGSDPPVSAEELSLIKSASQRANSLYVVLNKADLVDPQAIERVKQFTRDVIKTELGAEPERIFHVSARDVLKGKLDKELNALVEILVELSNQSRSDLAGNSARHAVIYLSHLLIQKIELEKLALLAPLSELDARIESFQRSMKDISDLMLAILTRTKQELKYDWETWESNRQNAVVKGKSLILTSITKELRQSRNRRTQFRKIAKELARTQIRTFLEGWLLNTVEWVNANYSSHAGYVKRETDRLIERVANAASEAFGISIQPYYVVNLDFDPDKLAFDLNIPVLALDISDSLAFCLDLFLPKNIVIAQTIRQTEMLLDEWLLRNMYKIDESVIHWISNSTKLLHDSMQERMKAMQDEILSVLAEGRKRREAGGSAIKNRLMFLESLKARLDALCNEIRID
jgi:signal recognition particle receptor subunit beta